MIEIGDNGGATTLCYRKVAHVVNMPPFGRPLISWISTADVA